MARGQGEGTISQQPDGKWCARITTGYDANGKQKRKAFYGKTRKEVLQKLTAAQNEVNNNTFIDPSRLTIADWGITWLEEYKKRTVKPTYYGTLHYYMHHYTIPAIGKIKLKDLRPEHVQKFVNQLSDTGLSPTTVKSIYRAINGALEQAVTNELIAKNVSAKVKFPKESKPEMSVLSQDEQTRFITAAKKTVTGRAYILALCTGLRLGEMLALTWEDVDFQNGMLSVNKAHSKGMAPKPDGTGYKTTYTVGAPKTKSSVRMIPLLPDILEMLKTEKENALPSEYNLIFPDIKGGYILHNTARLRFVAILKEAGIPEAKQLHPHSLRHSFATRGLENGIPLKVMQELLGHANIGMTADLYTHVLPETKQAEMMKLADTVNLTPPIGAEQQDTATPK